MEHKLRKHKVKFPQTALAFYIKIYCKRKGSTKTKFVSNLVEATKAWLSLTEVERKQVNKSYEEYKHKYKLQCFNKLKNAEPFLKVKVPRVENTSLHNNCLVTQDSENTECIIPQPFNIDPDTAAHKPDSIENEETSADCGLIEHMDEPSQHSPEKVRQLTPPRPLLIEPLPPTLKTGKDLFHMLKLMDGANSTWSSLSNSEKRQYSQAVCVLKNDYITKYRQYLESLTPRELFDYYNKAVF